MAPTHLDLPTSTQYITFPTQQTTAIRVSWTEGSQAKSATYYVSKCYWGTCANATTTVAESKPPQPIVEQTKKLSVLGETTIFIASEFTDPEFQDGPIAAYHIKDLAKNSQGIAPNWITMQLNDCFHYGQNSVKGKWRRWIVYHPPIAAGMKSPQMFQHRFVSPASAEFANIALNALPDLAPDDFSVAASATSILGSVGIDYLKGIKGDLLHQFLGPKGVKDAEALQKKLVGPKMPNGGNTIDQRITALQYVETLDAKDENMVSEKEETERRKEAAKYFEAMRKDQAKSLSLWQRLRGVKPIIGNVVHEEQKPSSDDEAIQKILQELTNTTIIQAEHIINRPPSAPRVERPRQQTLHQQQYDEAELDVYEDDSPSDEGEEELHQPVPTESRLRTRERAPSDPLRYPIDQKASPRPQADPYDLVGSSLGNSGRRARVIAPRQRDRVPFHEKQSVHRPNYMPNIHSNNNNNDYNNYHGNMIKPTRPTKPVVATNRAFKVR